MTSGSRARWTDRLDLDDPGQRVGPLVRLPDMLREFRVDPDELLLDLGLPRDALASPERRIPYFQLGGLLRAAADRSGCEHFGLLFGQRLDIGHMGTLGDMARNAPTVGDAVRTMAVHQRLHSRGALAFVITEGNRATTGFTSYHASTVGADQVHDAMATWLLNIMRALTVPGWLPDVFLLARSRPAETAPYRRALPGRIEFDAEYTGLRFNAAVLEQTVPLADPLRFAMLEGQVAAIGRHSLLNDVRRALRLQMIHGGAANDRVAQTLDMHRRTLHRHLRECGTTFRQVLDEVRYDTARHFLQLTEIPLMQIAISLGYADVTAFTRAFKRWSGMTPSRFREGGTSPVDTNPAASERSAATPTESSAERLVPLPTKTE